MGEKYTGVVLEEEQWKRVLNLLNEELEVWGALSSDYAQIEIIIGVIETRTGIKKKPRPEVEKP